MLVLVLVLHSGNAKEFSAAESSELMRNCPDVVRAAIIEEELGTWPDRNIPSQILNQLIDQRLSTIMAMPDENKRLQTIAVMQARNNKP